MENDFYDKFFESFINAAAKETAEELGKELPEPESAASPKLDARVASRVRRRERMGKLRHYLPHAACFFLVFAIIGTGSIGGNALLERTMIFDFDNSKPNAEIKFIESSNSYSNDMVNLYYMPDGFTVSRDLTKDKTVVICFDNTATNKYFGLEIHDIEFNFSVDTEDMEMQELAINGKKAIFLTKPRVNILIWYDDYHSYMIDSDIKEDEMIKIAENIRLK